MKRNYGCVIVGVGMVATLHRHRLVDVFGRVPVTDRPGHGAVARRNFQCRDTWLPLHGRGVDRLGALSDRIGARVSLACGSIYVPLTTAAASDFFVAKYN